MKFLQHKSRLLWMTLFLLSFGTFSFFLAEAAIKTYHYVVFSIPVIPKTMHWKVKEVKEGVFNIEVAYWFNYKNKTYQKVYLFNEKPLGNKQLAYEQIQFLQQKPWTVWLSKWSVEDSTLERTVSLKLILRAFLAFAVFAYFIFLHYYYARSEESDGKRFEI